MWRQLAFLLVCVALVHALPASSKDKFEKFAHALDDLVQEEIEHELGEGGQGQGARSFYLIKAMKHPKSTGDPPLKGRKPQNDQKPGSQPESTGRPPKPDATDQPSKEEPFYEYLPWEEMVERKQKEHPKSDDKKPRPPPSVGTETPAKDDKKPDGKPPKPEVTGQFSNDDRPEQSVTDEGQWGTRPRLVGTFRTPMDDEEPLIQGPSDDLVERIYEYLRWKEMDERKQKERPKDDKKPDRKPQGTNKPPKLEGTKQPLKEDRPEGPVTDDDEWIPDGTGRPLMDGQEPPFENERGLDNSQGKSDDKKRPPKGTRRPPVRERGFVGDQNKEDGEKRPFKGTGKPPMDGQVKSNHGDDQRQGNSEPPKAKERDVKDDENKQQGPKRPVEGAGEPSKDDKEVDGLKEGAMKNRFLKRVLVLLSNLR